MAVYHDRSVDYSVHFLHLYSKQCQRSCGVPIQTGNQLMHVNYNMMAREDIGNVYDCQLSQPINRKWQITKKEWQLD